jgi:hypothetical protein
VDSQCLRHSLNNLMLGTERVTHAELVELVGLSQEIAERLPNNSDRGYHDWDLEMIKVFGWPVERKFLTCCKGLLKRRGAAANPRFATSNCVASNTSGHRQARHSRSRLHDEASSRGLLRHCLGLSRSTSSVVRSEAELAQGKNARQHRTAAARV